MLLYELEYLILECSLKNSVFKAFLQSFNLVLRNEKILLKFCIWESPRTPWYHNTVDPTENYCFLF